MKNQTLNHITEVINDLKIMLLEEDNEENSIIIQLCYIIQLYSLLSYHDKKFIPKFNLEKKIMKSIIKKLMRLLRSLEKKCQRIRFTI